MSDYKKILDAEKQEWMINQLFKVLGFNDIKSERPFRLLNEFSKPQGKKICGGGDFACILSDYYEPNQEYYMGKNKVRIIDDLKNEEIILDEKDFYPYIEKYSREYMKNNEDKKDRVMECLVNIRRYFKM